MTRAEVGAIIAQESDRLTWEWTEANHRDPKRQNVSILRIVARGGGMQCQQDFTEWFLSTNPTAPERLRDSLRVMRAWVKTHDEMAAQAAKVDA